MAMLDKQSWFGDAIDTSHAAGTIITDTTLNANYIDTGPLKSGNEGLHLSAAGLAFYYKQTAALVGGGASMEVLLYSGATAGVATNIHWRSGVIGVASWVINKTYLIPLPYESGVQYLQFLGIELIISGATTTAGTASAGILPMASGILQDLVVNDITY